MRIDLLHNRIVAGTVTARFGECVADELVPLLAERYPALEGILMYEDYLDCDLLVGGEWYYPFTVFAGGAAESRFVKWQVGEGFVGGCPYSYTGAAPIGFEIPDTLPEGIENVTRGRAITYSTDTIGVRIVTKEKDPTFLVGRYSQTFVDELARQITAELKRVLAVEGIGNGTLELQLVFASETYMEHTSENVTYRRLLLTDKGCRPRDFWVKWTRLDGVVGYTVSDTVSAENIKFEIGEDVPQKVREKEFRFLCRANPDKYQSAMGKRTVTEWRELIKRSLKRGELKRLEVVPPTPAEDDLDTRLKAVLGNYAAITGGDAPEVDDSDIALMARAALGENAHEAEEPVVEEPVGEIVEEYAEPAEEISEEAVEEYEDPTEESDQAAAADSWTPDAEPIWVGFDKPVEVKVPDEPELPSDLIMSEEDEVAEESAEEKPVEEKPAEEKPVEEKPAPEADDYAELERLREERLRREIEAKLRLEYEAEARVKAEAEAERLRAEHERLREENERLREEARLREEERARAEQQRAVEAERLRIEEERRKEEEERARRRIAEQARLEEAERARLAEIARQAIEEQARLERARKEREEAERAERERLEKERAAREEAARLAEAQRREAERLRAAQPIFVTKHAKLIFRRSVDLNVIKRIKEIVEETLIANSKAHIHIYMKAYPIDSYTINLDMKLPDTEGELLVSIVKAIGNGHLGITKIIVE